MQCEAMSTDHSHVSPPVKRAVGCWRRERIIAKREHCTSDFQSVLGERRTSLTAVLELHRYSFSGLG